MRARSTTGVRIPVFVLGLVALFLLTSVLTGDPQAPGAKPPGSLLGPTPPVAGPKVPPPVGPAPLKIGEIPPRIEAFDTMKIDCVRPDRNRGLLHYKVSGNVGTVVIKQEGGARIDAYLFVAPPGAPTGSVPSKEESFIKDPYVDARITGYILQAFTPDRKTHSEKRIPIQYLENLVLTLRGDVTKTTLASTPTGKRVQYSVPARYGRLDHVSAVLRLTPPVDGVETQPRVTVTSSPPAASVPPGMVVDGTLTFVLAWGGPGWARLESARSHVGYTGERELCGAKTVGPVSAAVR